MTKSVKYLQPVLFALCCVVWMACTQERQPCLTPKIASLNIEFMHRAADTSTVFIDTALPAGVFRALTDSGVRGVYYPQPQSVFTISLSSVADSCRWAVTTDTVGTAFDTITFFYQRKLQFISNSCGYAYFYNLDSVHTTHVNIDSAHISNANVTNNVNTNHLQVYIHPDF